MKIGYIVKGVQIYGNTKEHINKKIAKLDKYFNDDTEVIIKINQMSRAKKSKVEVSIKTDKLELRSQEIDNNIVSAVTDCVADIERQIRKHKTRVAKRLHETAEYMDDIASEDAEEVEEAKTDIIREKVISVKPMSPAEAIDQMDMLSHSFFMFKNGLTGRVCTVYHRYNGGYGIIEIE